MASRHMAGYGAKVVVILLGSPSDLRSEEARLNWSIIEKMDSIELISGKEITNWFCYAILLGSFMLCYSAL